MRSNGHLPDQRILAAVVPMEVVILVRTTEERKRCVSSGSNARDSVGQQQVD